MNPGIGLGVAEGAAGAGSGAAVAGAAVMVNGGPVGVAGWPGATGLGVPMVWKGWKKKLDAAGVA